MIDRALRALVRRRAENCCEYCRLPQDLVPFVSFHVEHVIARQHGGGDAPDNLALACFHCNFHKGPNLSGLDLGSGEIAPSFTRGETSGTSTSRFATHRSSGSHAPGWSASTCSR